MFEVRISRQAIKDIASLPQEYARLVSQHIDRLKEEPRPPGARKLRNFTAVYRLRLGYTAFSMR